MLTHRGSSLIGFKIDVAVTVLAVIFIYNILRLNLVGGCEWINENRKHLE